MSEQALVRGVAHDRLEVFVGEWRAEGYSYGNSLGAAESWISSHTARWHTGRFFLIQDERATVGGQKFDTLSVLGVTEDRYAARTFENHGHFREYALTVDGALWTLTGDTERARIAFADGGRTQTITWQWRRDGQWVPLCDRIARRVD